MGELAHRTKNLISVIQGIAHQSFTGRPDANPKEALSLFNSRLGAIATAQTVLFEPQFESLMLHDLITRSLEGCGVDAQRVGVSGPHVLLSPSVGLMLSLAIHELCTNAFKYGALSVSNGAIAITWQVDRETPQRFDLRWEESGRPAGVTTGGQRLRRTNIAPRDRKRDGRQGCASLLAERFRLRIEGCGSSVTRRASALAPGHRGFCGPPRRPAGIHSNQLAKLPIKR